MSFLPDEDLKKAKSQNLAPMIDFLFLMLIFFASLAISRVTTMETEIDLVKATPNESKTITDSNEDKRTVNISISSDGSYKWVTEIHDYPLQTADEIKNELVNQYEKGLLPENKLNTQVLLKIDKEANWEPVLKAIFSIRDAGFNAYPLYEPLEEEV